MPRRDAGARPRLVLSGLRGSSGKTLVVLGLIAAWRRWGLSVVPFKKGPDYIDPAWHALAAGRVCRNLDTFLTGTEQVLRSFAAHSGGGCLAIVEGNRGLYDGVDAEGAHSTAQLAKLLRAPVILVADCSKVTRTMAALIAGCRGFDPGLAIQGVILNQVGGGRHEEILRTTIERYAGVPVLGALPRVKDGTFPERHLGLIPPQEHPSAATAIASAGDLMERYVDVAGLRRVAESAPLLEVEGAAFVAGAQTRETARPRVGVVRDSAFEFYYPENLEQIGDAGAEIVMASALNDASLPLLDALYIGGGFPETHAEALSANGGFRRSLREAIEGGLPVYAECGGLMYLGETLEIGGKEFPMAGALPVSFCVEERMQGHGYTEIEVQGRNPYFAVGERLVGHEFHYSRPVRWREGAFGFAFGVRRGRGFDGRRDGLCYRNVLATYTHLHALGVPGWAPAVVARARERMDSGSAAGGGKGQ